MISFNEFKKLELKVGTIKNVEEIVDSNKLIKLKVDIEVIETPRGKVVSLESIKGDETLAELYKNRYGNDPAETGSAIIKDEDRCIRCGLCAKKCPVDAITMERFIFKEVIDT